MFPRLALCAVLLTALTNCENNPLDSSLQSNYKAYQTESHYRAFAHVPDVAKRFGAPKRWFEGSAMGEKSAQAAIDTAMANCEAKGSPHKCRLYGIGNIEVSGLTGPQIDRAIAVYAENPSATNADLLANAAQAAEAKQRRWEQDLTVIGFGAQRVFSLGGSGLWDDDPPEMLETDSTDLARTLSRLNLTYDYAIQAAAF